MNAHVVMFSGGIGSWAAAKRVAEQHGTDDLWLLFTDTLIEDADLYRFLVEGAASVYRCAGQLDGIVQLAAATPDADDAHIDERRAHLARVRALVAPIMPRLAWIVEGRTPWEVFDDERYLGNTRADPCSRILKREMADGWTARRFTPDTVIRYVGIDWTESHRLDRMRLRLAPWIVKAPMCEAPYLEKPAMLAALAREGIRPPRLYEMGFAHNNCGGFCIKAGHAHFALLLRTMPERFAEHETKEEAIRQKLGNVAILRDRSGGQTRPLPLTQLKKRIECGQAVDTYDIGGCGCFSDVGDAA